jgi:hypothetical protein
VGRRKAASSPKRARRKELDADQSGQADRREAISSPISSLAVFDGRRCCGFLLPRGKQGVEAFNADDHSIGVFPDLKAAANAVYEAAS